MPPVTMPPVRMPPRARWPAAISGVQVKLAMQCAVSLLIALVVMRLLPFPRPYWLTLTALIVTTNSFGETAMKSLERIIGTILGLLAGTLIWLASGRAPVAGVAVMVVAVFALFYERTARYRVMLFWLSLLLSMLFHLGDAPGTIYLARLADTLIGTGIAVLVTMVLLPVRTGDEARAQVAALLGLAAGKLRRMAATVAAPGPNPRDATLAGVLEAAEKLSGLASAEGVEAMLLRRPRVRVRRRIGAAGALARGLLYADQLMPLLPDGETGVTEMLRAASTRLDSLAAAVSSGAVGPHPGEAEGPAETAGIAASHDELAAAFHAGRISEDQFHAAVRLYETLTNLVAAGDNLAASLPAIRPRGELAGLRAAAH